MIDTDGSHSPERMRRSLQQIVEQHGNILRLRQAVESALRRPDADELVRLLRQLSGAIEAHFELEEGAYYPPSAPIDGVVANTLLSLVEEHERLRTELQTLHSLLEEDRQQDFKQAFDAFSSALTDHEVREEKAMRDLANPT